VFSREQLAAVLAMAPESYKLLFEVLATTGLRISEGMALQRLHFQIDGSTPEVCDGAVIEVGGLVIARQRPETAKGVGTVATRDQT
jgi:integrase